MLAKKKKPRTMGFSSSLSLSLALSRSLSLSVDGWMVVEKREKERGIRYMGWGGEAKGERD